MITMQAMPCTVKLRPMFPFLPLASPGPPRYLQCNSILRAAQGAIITQWKFHFGRGRDAENGTGLDLSA